MPPVVVMDAGRAGAKWARRAGSAAGEYEEGIRTTTKSWARAASAAENNYRAGVTAAASAGRYGKGIAKSGDEKWKRGATEKGPMRFSQGVQAGERDYSSQVQPYLEAISRIDLPPRGPRGQAGNLARVGAIAKALGDLRASR